MGMFSEIDGEHDRKILREAIAKAKRKITKEHKLDEYSIELIDRVCELIKRDCNDNFVD